MRVVRIFVSSPNDAMAERRRVSRVVERLNAALADTARLEAVRWEERFYAAHDGFQPQIPRSGECDIVLAVLRGRIGSPLSAAFHDALPPEERPPAGQTYASGTAYEILSAIRARQEGRHGDSPDVYIFRWPTPPQVSLDAPDRADIEAQWAALKRFTDAVFLTAEGQFKGAYQTYASLDDFEAQTEALLRDWLKRHVLGDRTVLWPAERGSPFRGLEPFGMKHAAVFFGRSREIVRAAERLRTSAAGGLPVQLVIGPSGAGKSSFLRAGLVPRLIAPGEVEGVGAWRVAVMRPGESPEGPVAALARRLFEPASAIEPSEAGRPEALPELSAGAFSTPEALARQLAHADETSAAPVQAALDRVTEAGRQAWGSDKPEPARLLLVVDQLDEIFSTAITEAQRAGFARLLEALARSGSVWVVLSLRAEFYEVFLKSPLAGLAGDERTLTLKPPGLPEMAEIVREPARAADLAWEADPATGERLDERLLADIDRPDLLPLLQFVLDRLYEKREGGGGEPQRLTFAAYRALGTLDGAIRQEAERAFAGLGPAEQAALPRLLRGLVVPAQAAGGGAGAEAGTFALVPAALSAVAPSEAGRRLAAALVDARLLSSGVSESGEATVGLAHQRVVEAWDRARTIVAESAGFHRVRAGVESRRRDWEGAKRPADLLLPRGVFLAQAEEVAASYGDEFTAQDLDYLQASRRHAGRALRRAYAAAVLFAAVAVAAVAAGVIAYQQRREAEAQRQIAETEQSRAEAQQKVAERNFALARETVDRVVSSVTGGLRNVEGMRVATLKRILAQVEGTMRQLTEAAPDEPSIQRSRARMLVQFGLTYQAAGDAPAAVKSYQEAIDIDRLLVGRPAAERAPAEGAVNRSAGTYDLAGTLYLLGEAKRGGGDPAGALAAYEESAALFRRVIAQSPDNFAARTNLARAVDEAGTLKLRTGDTAAALAAYEEGLTLSRALIAQDPNNGRWQFDLMVSLHKLADLKRRMGDAAAALAADQEALDLCRALAKRDPANTVYQANLAASLVRVGDLRMQAGDGAAALGAFQESLGIGRAQIARDPDNAHWKTDLLAWLGPFAELKRRMGDAAAVQSAMDEMRDLRRALAARKPDGDAKGDGAKEAGAKADEAASDPSSASGAAPAAREAAVVRRDDPVPPGTGLNAAKADASGGADKPGGAPPRAGEAATVAGREEAVAAARARLQADPSNAGSQEALALALGGLGDLKLQAGDDGGARAAREETVALRRALAARDPGNADWQARLGFGLFNLGDLSLKSGDAAGALKAHEEALALRRALVKRDPSNADWQHDLGFSLMRVGTQKLKAGDAAGARASYEEAVTLRRSLSQRDPTNVQWQRDLAFSEARLGALRRPGADAARGAPAGPGRPLPPRARDDFGRQGVSAAPPR